MKHLLNGVAVAALLALAVPAWAQGAAPSSKPAAAAPAAKAPAESKTTSATAPKPRPHRMAHQMVHHRMAKAAPAHAGNIANQLNRQELSEIQSGK